MSDAHPARESPADTPARLHVESLCWLASLTAVGCLEAWVSRGQLNPDGVAYLDLADALRRGDWSSFVQGYWSPAYPLLLAVSSALAHMTGGSVVAAAHVLNAMIVAVGGVLVLRLVSALWERRIVGDMPSGFWLRTVWATYAVCSLVLTRIDAITPDVLLLLALIALCRELLVHGGERPLQLGVWLGAAFLVKTSTWPWLLVMLAVLASPWSPGPAARRVAVAAAVAVAIALAWVIPMSVKYGAPTIGSTGRLNACWYLRGCDSRSPDTHRGAHDAWRTVALPAGDSAIYAPLTGSDWSYAPWSDPTAWDARVRSRSETPLTAASYLPIVGRNMGDALRLALVYLYAGILVPVLLWWRLGGLRVAVTALTPWAAVATLLGATGIAQFVAVHVESRLLAPFAFLHVVGFLSLFLGARTTRGAAAPASGAGRRRRGKERQASQPSPSGTPAAKARATSSSRAAAWGDLLSWIPVAMVLVLLGMSLRGEAINGDATAAYRDELLRTSSRASNGFVQRNVVVVGEAFPLLAHARALGVRLVAQVLPPSAAALDRIDPLARQQVLLQVLQDAAGSAGGVAWQLRPDGRVMVTRLR